MRISTFMMSLAGLLAAAGACAWESEGGMWTVNGFGTVGAVHSDEHRADYLPGPLMYEGPGRSGATSFETDSRLALQVSATPWPRVSAVVQLVSEQGADGRYTPDVEWANVGYSLTPDVQLRAGRVVLETFLASDYRKVGYALPWVRPPVEVYRLNPITNSDGADLSYRLQHGDWLYRGRITFGSAEFDSDDESLEATDALGLFNTLEWRAFTWNLAYQQARIEIPSITDLFAGFASFGPEGLGVVDEYDSNGSRISFVTAGMSYDPGAWFFMTEYARSGSSPLFGAGEGWYLSGGYRFGPVTPYATFASARNRRDTAGARLTPAFYPPEVVPVVNVLNTALEEILGSVPEQRTWSVGARWDVFRNAALKAQYDHVDVGGDSWGTFGNREPGFRPDQVGLFSVSVDFLF